MVKVSGMEHEELVPYLLRTRPVKAISCFDSVLASICGILPGSLVGIMYCTEDKKV